MLQRYILFWLLTCSGVAYQYVGMPLLASIVVFVLKPDPATAAGILIVGCVPGAMALNVLTLGETEAQDAFERRVSETRLPRDLLTTDMLRVQTRCVHSVTTATSDNQTLATESNKPVAGADSVI